MYHSPDEEYPIPDEGERIIEIIQLSNKDRDISKLAFTSIITRGEGNDLSVNSFIFNFGRSDKISLKLLRKAGFISIDGILL